MTTDEQARAAATAYQFSTLSSPSWLRGIGVGKDAYGYYVKVNTSKPVNLSPTFNGVRVVVDIVGDIEAL